MAKCVGLWNTCSRSPQKAEKIYGVIERQLPHPGTTRWNSLFDSLKCLLDTGEKLNRVFDAVGASKPTQRELEFLKEYVQVTQHLAKALDHLQGEKFVFLGDLLPMLRGLLVRERKLLGTLVHATAFAQKIIDSIQGRFSNALNVDQKNPSDFLIATISHPFHKLTWILDEDVSELTRSFVEIVIQNVPGSTKLSSTASSPKRNEDEDDDFFGYGNKDVKLTPIVSTADKVKMEVMNYLEDSRRDLKVLLEYPNVRRIFMKFNTTLTSSAPVEREFSTAGLILTPRRCRLGDETFNKLVFLKCNKFYW